MRSTMRINSLKIKGFRNLNKIELSFDDDKSVFALIGQNGHGKTNILEAMYMCALSKSFRTRVNQDLITFDDDFCRIESKVSVNSEEKELEIIVTSSPPQKVLKVNGVKRPAKDFVGILKAVFFSPDDLSEMAFAPKLRRRYMDVILSQLDSAYLDDLIRYQDVTRQRNALLKQIKEGRAKSSELDFWDEKLAELGLSIIQKRADLIFRLQKLIKKLYQSISQTKDELEIRYISETVKADNKESLITFIQKNHDRDIATGVTQIGPHRDDLGFMINGHDMVYFASRGEWRSLVLALKFAEIQLIEEKCGEKPILLLDDVFSELDEIRQKYLFEAIKGTQTFITTTHKEFLDGISPSPVVFEVKSGTIL